MFRNNGIEFVVQSFIFFFELLLQLLKILLHLFYARPESLVSRFIRGVKCGYAVRKFAVFVFQSRKLAVYYCICRLVRFVKLCKLCFDVRLIRGYLLVKLFNGNIKLALHLKNFLF